MASSDGNDVAGVSLREVPSQIRESLTNVVLDAVKKSSRMSSHNQRSLINLSNASRLRLDDKLKLHGRDNEMKMLRTKLRGLASAGGDETAPRSPEMLLISGVSGSGKSALVMRGLRDPAKRMGLMFVSGKFDQNKNKVPLSAFASAMASLAEQVAENEDSRKIKREISEALDEDAIRLLSQALPGCDLMFQGTRKSDECMSFLRRRSSLRRHSLGREGEGSRLLLQHAIQRLLKVVCSNIKGLVLFIDDLQVRIKLCKNRAIVRFSPSPHCLSCAAFDFSGAIPQLWS